MKWWKYRRYLYDKWVLSCFIASMVATWLILYGASSNHHWEWSVIYSDLLFDVLMVIVLYLTRNKITQSDERDE